MRVCSRDKNWWHAVTNDVWRGPSEAWPQSRCTWTRRRRLEPRHPFYRAAFTLLEVILALAILAGALASLGEVVRLSVENANFTRDHSHAQLLAASKLAEITAGVEELATVERVGFELDTKPLWLYSIQWEATDEEDLIAVRVTVEQDLPSEQKPVQFSLTRWMPDPGVVIEEDATSTDSPGTSDGTEEK